MRYSEELNGAFYLGRVGDNLTTTLIISVKGWTTSYGSGTFSVLHQRNGDAGPYPCSSVTYDETTETLSWPITNADVAISGKGELQVYYTVNGAVVRSEIYITITQRSLGDTVDPPDPWESWVEEVMQARDDAEAAADAAEDAQDAAETAQEGAEAAQEGAEAAQEAIEDMEVGATTLEAGQSATVTKTQVEEHVKLTFGIPKGIKGDTGNSGVYIGTTEPTEGDINVWINPNDVANRGYVPSGGTTGQVLKKKTGTNFDTEWGDVNAFPTTADAGDSIVYNGTSWDKQDSYGYTETNYTTQANEYTWDGVTTGKETVAVTIGSTTYNIYKIYDSVPKWDDGTASNICIVNMDDEEAESAVSANSTVIPAGIEIVADTTSVTNAYILKTDDSPVGIYAKETITALGVTISKGLWFVKTTDGDYGSRLVVNYKIASWDGTTTGRESIDFEELVLYKISSDVAGIDIDNFADAQSGSIYSMMSSNSDYELRLNPWDTAKYGAAVLFAMRWSNYETERIDYILWCTEQTTVEGVTVPAGIWVSKLNASHYINNLAYGIKTMQTVHQFDAKYIKSSATLVDTAPTDETVGKVGDIQIYDDVVYMCTYVGNTYYYWTKLYPELPALNDTIYNGSALIYDQYNGGWIAQPGYGYVVPSYVYSSSSTSIGVLYKVYDTGLYYNTAIGYTACVYNRSVGFRYYTALTSNNVHGSGYNWYAEAYNGSAIVTVLVSSDGTFVYGGNTFAKGLWMANSWSRPYYQLEKIGNLKTIEPTFLPEATASTPGISKAVSVSATGTATDEVQYITVDGVEKKLAGGGSSYTAGTGINIANNVISSKVTFTLNGTELTITNTEV